MQWVNGLVGRSEDLDLLVRFIAGNPLIKGVPLAALFLFLWFAPHRDRPPDPMPDPMPYPMRDRARLLALLAVAVLAIVAGRAAALLLPYRARPLHDVGLDLRLPEGMAAGTLDGWSSFPSDHAVLYAALVTGFWMIRRGAGVLALLHALLVVAFARVYLALHFPTDILGGAAIGGIVALTLMGPLTALVQRAGLPRMAERWPQYFHPLLFVLLFQIATMFDSARQLVKGLLMVLT